MNNKNINEIVKLAAKNRCNGIIEEPRVWFDQFRPRLGEGGQLGIESFGDRQVFLNGEQFPVRITHVASAVLPSIEQDTLVGGPEVLISGYGMRIEQHSSYYMNDRAVTIPQWVNVPTSLPPLAAQQTATWELPTPMILSSRDSIVASARLNEIVNNGAFAPNIDNAFVSVSFSGTGLQSGRPYFLASTVDLVANPNGQFDPTDLRNDGAEPIALTNMTLTFDGTLDNAGASGVGDIRQISFRMRQQGNGTQAEVFQGPTTPTTVTHCPAVLSGWTGTRAVVHRFPGDGYFVEPGDGFRIGITPQLEGMTTDVNGEDVLPYIGVAMMGYIAVQ